MLHAEPVRCPLALRHQARRSAATLEKPSSEPDGTDEGRAVRDTRDAKAADGNVSWFTLGDMSDVDTIGLYEQGAARYSTGLLSGCRAAAVVRMEAYLRSDLSEAWTTEDFEPAVGMS